MDSPREVSLESMLMQQSTARLTRIHELEAEVAALKKLLRKYGCHQSTCEVVWKGSDCTCGYGAALARGGQG